ncbi:MAG: hypothetical protein MK135_08175 [Polyangiaceae bacterium]|nr:hypothetical protein [Polyangiaceae bacterium]
MQNSEKLNRAEREEAYYPAPILKVALATGLSGGTYLFWWSYQCWRAYRHANGYGASHFWQAVGERSGYHVSPFLRSLLTGAYLFALLPAMARDCRDRNAKWLLPPLLLALLLNVSIVLPQGWLGFILPGLLMVPIQSSVNAANEKWRSESWSLRPAEVFVVLVGLMIQLGGES